MNVRTSSVRAGVSAAILLEETVRRFFKPAGTPQSGQPDATCHALGDVVADPG